jgi:Uma2 family endonuclease
MEEVFTYQLNMEALGSFTDEQFFNFCQQNKELRLERDYQGQIIIIAPTGSETSKTNASLLGMLWAWNYVYKLGEIFDSNGGFRLPNSAIKAADVAWIHKDRWAKLSQTEKEKFAPICPDFIIELRSKNDKIEDLQTKMEEWMANGCQLAWLIDPQAQEVHIYRANQAPEIKTGFNQKISGESVLVDFELDLSKIL